MPLPMYSPRRWLPAVLTFALTGCGGGGGGGSGGSGGEAPAAPPPDPSLSGVVAVGAPLANYRVDVFSAYDVNLRTGSAGRSTVTDANGRYTIPSLNGMRPPYLVRAYRFLQEANQQYPRLFAITMQGGTANVNPLTDLMVAQLAGSPPGFDITEWSSLATVTGAQIDTARQAVVDYLLLRPSTHSQSVAEPVDASKIGDFVATPMQASPSDPYDNVLEQLQRTMLHSENIFGLEAYMSGRHSPPVDLSSFIGSYIQCEFNQCGGTDQQGRITAPFVEKYPLIMELARQINQRGFIYFNCGSSPAIGGFEPGTNRFSMDRTVARVNHLAPASYEFSLLSATRLYFYISASGGTGNPYISSISADNNIGVGYDSITLRLTENQQITEASFTDRRAPAVVSCNYPI